MTLYQVAILFLNGAGHASLYYWSRQFPNVDYQLLTAFFRRGILPQMLVAKAWQRFHPLTKGWLIIDEIILAKSKVGRCPAVKRRYKSAGGYVTPGLSVVVLLWTDGVWRVPLRFKLWRPGDGTAVDVALELFGWVRNELHWKPTCVLFDAGFAAARLLVRLNNYGWAFVCRAPKSRKLDGVQLWQYKRQGYWHAVGEAWCGIKLLVIRRKANFYLTNRLSRSAEEALAWYSERHEIEETLKLFKGVCHWGSCQSSDDEAIERFLAVGMVVFMVWEAERVKAPSPTTIYQLRKKATLSPRMFIPPSLKRLPKVS